MGWGSGPWGSGPWGLGSGSGLNLGFEVEDELPGLPEAWVLETSDSSLRAAFGADPGDPEEGFETGWGDVLTAHGTVTPALFGIDDDMFDGFETGWAGFSTSFGGLESATFDTAPEAHEDFEEEWGSFKDEFVGIGTDLSAASFDVTPEAHEDFEEDWSGAVAYKTSFTGVGTDLEAASFDGPSPEAVEDFEEVAFDAPFTVTPASGTIHVDAHGLSTNDLVSFRNEEGRLPENLLTGVSYVVAVIPSVDSFRVMPVGGTAPDDVIIFQDYGFGSHFLIYDGREFWNGTELAA